MFENIRNNIDFFIRNNIRISRKNYIEKSPRAIERNYLENLYTKDILSRCLSKSDKNSLRVLDIGCKNWFYVKGEHEFFNDFCNDFTLDGVEIDAYRLYTNFYSRYETAKFYMKGLNNTHYIPANLLDLSEKYDYIVWFLPFVLKEPHRMWGLPDRFFYPQKLLAHAADLLNENGEMLIVNQGFDEALEQKRLLENLGIVYIECGELKSEFFEYAHKRYGFVIKK